MLARCLLLFSVVFGIVLRAGLTGYCRAADFDLCLQPRGSPPSATWVLAPRVIERVEVEPVPGHQQ